MATGALFARNPYNSEFPDRVAYFDADETSRTVTGDRAEFLGRNGVAAETCRDEARIRFRARSAPRWIRARRSRSPSNSRQGRSARSSSGMGVGASIRDARAHVVRFRGTAAAQPRSNRCGDTGSARSAPCRWKRPTNRSTCWPTAGSCTRRWPAACGPQRLLPVGRSVRLPRPVAGRDGAGARRASAWSASTSCCAPAVSSWRVTSSTGGIRRRVAACARAVPDDYLWLPLATVSLRVRRPETRGSWTRPSRFSKVAAVDPEDESYYDLPGRSREIRTRCTSTACAQSRTALAIRRARPAADGVRATGTTA